MVPLFLHHYFRDCRVFSFFSFFASTYPMVSGFPGGASGEESTCQGRRFRRRGFNPWVRKMPWHRRWQPTSAFLSGKFHGQRRLVSYTVHRIAKSWTQLSTHTCKLTEPHLGEESLLSQWQPTPVLLPGKSHRWRRLVGCSPWGR